MIKFNKLRDVKDPKRNSGDAGIDLFIPNCTKEFQRDLEAKNDVCYGDCWNGIIKIPAGQDILIPAGVQSKFRANVALVANNKSGIATKKKLTVGAQVIDSSYQGEIHIHLFNNADHPVEVSCGQKIVQLVPYYIDSSDVEVTMQDSSSFYDGIVTDRGNGGFGSTSLSK